MENEGLDNVLDVTIHGSLNIATRIVNAMVGDAILRVIVSTDFLGTVAGANEGFASIGSLGAIIGDFALKQTRTEYSHGALTVLLLRTFVLHSNNNTGREMRDTNSGVGRIDALPTVATRTINVDAKIFGLDFNIGFFSLREDGNRSSASMNAPLAFGNWNTLDAVNATFEFELAIWLFTRDTDDDLLVAASIVNRLGLELNFEAVSLSITKIHAIKIASKKRSFVATGTGADF